MASSCNHAYLALTNSALPSLPVNDVKCDVGPTEKQQEQTRMTPASGGSHFTSNPPVIGTRQTYLRSRGLSTSSLSSFPMFSPMLQTTFQAAEGSSPRLSRHKSRVDSISNSKVSNLLSSLSARSQKLARVNSSPSFMAPRAQSPEPPIPMTPRTSSASP